MRPGPNLCRTTGLSDRSAVSRWTNTITSRCTTDRMLLEFTRDGKFMRMIGGSFAGPPDSNSKTSVGRAAGLFVDTANHEVYVADGYMNGRVVKFDSTTGVFIQAWGAYGKPPR